MNHNLTTRLRDIQWPRGGEERFFNLQVTPMFDATEAPLGTKIVFSDVTRQHELQDELQRSRQDLETAYEELQSTNEELETTNEELQSTNEELESVNQELRRRGVDLSRLNVFLGGILRTVPLGVVVVDDNLHVELWNDVAADLWGLRSDEVKGKHFFALDIGLPIEHLKQPLAHIIKNPEERVDTTIDAVNRRGRAVRVRVQAASTGAKRDGDQHGAAIIMLMQEAAARVH